MKNRRTTAALHQGNDKPDASFHQTKVFPFSSSSLNVDIFHHLHPGSPALRFLSMFAREGSWGLKFNQPRSKAVFDAGMLLFTVALSKPVGGKSLGFSRLASCEIKAASPSRVHLHFSAEPVRCTRSHKAKKIKLA